MAMHFSKKRILHFLYLLGNYFASPDHLMALSLRRFRRLHKS
jgi:hypothetical protein